MSRRIFNERVLDPTAKRRPLAPANRYPWYTDHGLNEKPVTWVGPSKKELGTFPEDVVDAIGFALGDVQNARMPANAKVMQGFGGASVLEIVANDASGTFRAVYTVKFEEAVYILHCFQKKSTQGIKTSKQDLHLIRKRLAWAEEIHKRWKESSQAQTDQKK